MSIRFEKKFNFSENSTNRKRWYQGAMLAALMFTTNLYAAVFTLSPSDDGWVAPNGAVDTSGYLLVGANGWDGVVKFPLASVQGIITQATLTVNPYALPLFGNPVEVFGRGDSSGLLAASDFGKGSYLGSWTLPNLGFGQDASFDVTSLLSTLNSPYVAFNLRSGSVDQFSSIERNYGHPSQLIITTVVPEPSALCLLGVGVIGAWWQRKGQRSNR